MGRLLTGAELDSVSVFKEKSFWVLCQVLTFDKGARNCSIVFNDWLDHALFKQDGGVLLRH